MGPEGNAANLNATVAFGLAAFCKVFPECPTVPDRACAAISVAVPAGDRILAIPTVCAAPRLEQAVSDAWPCSMGADGKE